MLEGCRGWRRYTQRASRQGPRATSVIYIFDTSKEVIRNPEVVLALTITKATNEKDPAAAPRRARERQALHSAEFGYSTIMYDPTGNATLLGGGKLINSALHV